VQSKRKAPPQPQQNKDMQMETDTDQQGGGQCPLVSMKFSIGDAVVTTINILPCGEGGDRKPFDPNEISPDAAASNMSFNYSGRHDHGKLPELHSTGPYADLVSALQEAKDKLELGTVPMEAQAGAGGQGGAGSAKTHAADEQAEQGSACKKPRPS
jgi:hypothetical protein